MYIWVASQNGSKKKHTRSLFASTGSTPGQAAVEESQERSDLVLRDVKGDPQ